jgi:hypothetical protein
MFLRGLPGADVLMGGRTIATSDAHGVALASAAEPIGEFDVVLPGWRVLAVHAFGSGHEPLCDGLGFVLMVRN